MQHSCAESSAPTRAYAAAVCASVAAPRSRSNEPLIEGEGVRSDHTFLEAPRGWSLLRLLDAI
eukprot:1160883-Pelagomonas_calceolata.AAC.3